MVLRIYCMIFVLVLFLPFLQHNYDIFPTVALGGVEEGPPEISWSVKGWLDGSFQKAFSKRRESRLGLRSYLVKTFNQIHYSFFKRVVSSSGTRVVIGKENWLFEKQYIEKINTPSWDQGYWMEVQANSLRILQETLAESGTAFVFVLAPSKADVYREYVPEKLINDPLPDGQKTDYQYLQAALKKYSVNFVDCHTLFMEEKQKKEYQLYPPSGTHWNKYGAYLVWKNIQQLVGNQLRVPLRGLDIDRVETRPSEPEEADLAVLLNLWRSSLTDPVTDYPVFEKQQQTKHEKPSVLAVGDSYLFTLLDIARQANLATEVDAWYYFNTHFKYSVKGGHLQHLSAATSSPLDINNIDWQKEMFDKDLVILIETQQWLPDIGFGFLPGALEAIKLRATSQLEH